MSISDVVNLDLLLSPYNWVTVALMLLIGTMALCLLIAPLGQVSGLVSVV